MSIRLTRHAIKRYRERVADVPVAEIYARLETAALDKAIAFGAHFVRLGTGHHLVLEGDLIITVLPKEACLAAFRPEPGR